MHTKNSPAMDKSKDEKEKFSVRRKTLAIILVGILVVSALAMVLPALLQNINAPADNAPAKSTANNGQREVTWKFSNMFEMYMPNGNSTNHVNNTFETAGHHTTIDGMPSWFPYRDVYQEKILRNEYPHIFYYSPYSTQSMSPLPAPLGFMIWAPYRMTIVAKNVTDCNTRNDAFFIPDMDTISPNGGWINSSWYGTYMTTLELTQARAGKHFCNWLYGVPGGKTPYATSDDGYYFQLMGKHQFSREAAMSYLGWDGVGDVRTWFDANKADITFNWQDQWAIEGSAGGAYDIFTAYDWNEDLKWDQLKLDSFNSTADELMILSYDISWGMDAQIVRYLEAANIVKRGFQNWMEDMYLNMSISPSMTNLTLRATCAYHLSGWADPNNPWIGAWSFEAQHMDWTMNNAMHTSYISPYTQYDPRNNDYRRPAYVPWTVLFGQPVTYWIAPRNNSLAQYETIIINSQTKTPDILAVQPGVGANDTITGVAGAFKRQELLDNLYWGSMVLSDANWPNDIIRNAYDPTTKTITLRGPMSFLNESQPGHPEALMHGVPMIIYDVAKVASYRVEVNGSHYVGLQDWVNVTALNATGAVVTNWNGTVDLVCDEPGADFAGPGTTTASHTFVPGDNGVWRTFLTWDSAPYQWWNVNATDQIFSLDVTGNKLTFVVPEFQTLLIPIVGVIALFFVVRAKKRKEEE